MRRTHGARARADGLLSAVRPVTRRDSTQRDRDRRRLAKLKAPCHICGKPIDYALRWPDPLCFVADHVDPLARGGADNIGNKLAAHNRCNASKGDRTHANGIIRRSGALER